MSGCKCASRVLVWLVLILITTPGPDSFLAGCVARQYRTKTTPVVKSPKAASEEAPAARSLIYGVQEENGSRVQNFALDLTPPPEVVYKSEPGTSDGMNVLGIVIFSATMGTCAHLPRQRPGAWPSLHIPSLQPSNRNSLESPHLPGGPFQRRGSSL